MGPKIKIGTHNGTFHCDEVLACAMLKIKPEYSTAEIVRYIYFLSFENIYYLFFVL